MMSRALARSGAGERAGARAALETVPGQRGCRQRRRKWASIKAEIRSGCSSSRS